MERSERKEEKMAIYVATFAPTVEIKVEIEADSPEEAWDIAEDACEVIPAEELYDLLASGEQIFEDSLVSVDPLE